MSNEKRLLSDADIQAIVDQIEKRAEARFYGDLGRGVWSLVWKVLIGVLVGIAAYGAWK